MEITVLLDWIRYSAPTDYPLNSVLPDMLIIDHTAVEIQPLKNYSEAYRVFPAGRIDINSMRPTQGMLVTFTGDDLRTLASEGIRAEFVLRHAHEKRQLKASRIDIAIDIKHAVASPLDLWDAWLDDRIKTHAKKCKAIDASEKKRKKTGATTYIGSRTSDTFVRVYDKGLESKSDELWTRIEIELKKSQARAAQHKIPSTGLSQVASNKLSSYMVVSGVSWWSRMVNALPSAQGEPLGERKSNSSQQNKWLYEQALTAVCKAIEARDNTCIDAVLKSLISLHHASDDINTGDNDAIDLD